LGDRQVLSKDRGSATVEFVLLIPMLVLILAAGLSVVSVARARVELLGAVRDGARVAATTPDPAKAVAAVQEAIAPEMRNRVRVSVSRPSVVGRPARVVARMSHPLGLPFPPGLTVEVSASASMLVER
jgi:Flp pilus assembly protein TadG